MLRKLYDIIRGRSKFLKWREKEQRNKKKFVKNGKWFTYYFMHGFFPEEGRKTDSFLSKRIKNCKFSRCQKFVQGIV